MITLFLHGWQSTPGGLKPTYLKDHGHTVLNPALPERLPAALEIAQAEYMASPMLWSDHRRVGHPLA